MNESPTLHRCSWLCFIGEIVGRMDGRYPVFFGKRDPGPKSHFKKCAGTVKLHKRTMTFPFVNRQKWLLAVIASRVGTSIANSNQFESIV